MLLDACSTDEFARALIKRAALLKFPTILAAAETAGLIETVFGEDQTEQEKIKRHLSGFAGLGPALDSL